MANVPHITEKQRKFVEILITKGAFQSGKDCATEAGYEESCATVMASKLQNPKSVSYTHLTLPTNREV